ncbi:MAG: hypothetical protein Tsb0019_11720 [Roseibium sp.]
MNKVPGLVLLFLLLSSATARAAVEPILRMDMVESSAVPGQPITVRLTVLVPTWLLEPPVFPSFEVPNVLTRVPSRGTGPTSERVGSETWSGVTRSYRLSPMSPGRFRIPEGTVTLTFADPETRQPVRTDLAAPGFEIVGSLPPGAEDMAPFIAARSLSLERTVEGDPAALTAGDALVLSTVAKVSGVSPLFLPELVPVERIDGLSAYPQSPVIEEKEERGIVSGSRRETVTYMAEFAGRYTIPAQTLDWYNVDSGKVETVQLAAIDVTVTEPAVSEPLSSADGAMFRKAGPWLIAAGVAAVSVLVLLRLAGSARFQSFLERYRDSEACAYRTLRRDLRSRNFVKASRSAVTWQNRVKRTNPNADWRAFDDALAILGEARFGSSPTTETPERANHWQAVARAARTVRHANGLAATARRSVKLPPLNPAA